MSDYNEIMVTAPRGRYQRRKRGPSLLLQLMSLILCGVLFGSAAALAFYGTGKLLSREEAIQENQLPVFTEENPTEETVLPAEPQPAVRMLSVPEIAEQSLRGVVSITNISIQEVQSYFCRFGPGGGQTRLQESTSCGSGVIFDADKEYFYIVTNAHVVEGANTLTVSFADDSAYDALLCGADSGLDLAVVKVSRASLTAETENAICIIAIGNSDALRVGEQVVAIGNALGYGQSVTGGIVSALHRGLSSGSEQGETYIQTDAAINPGNSGGALLNSSGELVGINSAKQASTEVEGMGYAIPITDVLSRIGVLMEQDTPLTPAAQAASTGGRGPGYWG